MADLAREAVSDPALLNRSAVASTFVAGLELAHGGRVTLVQHEGFGAIQVRTTQDGGMPAMPAVASC